MIDNRLILTISLLIILLFGFKLCGKRYSSPVVFFITPLIVQSTISFFYYPWNISDYTLFLITTSCIIFTLSCAMVHYIFRHFVRNTLKTNKSHVLLSNFQYILLIICNFACIAIILKGVKNSNGASSADLASIIGDFNNAVKTDDSQVSIGTFPSLIYTLLIGMSYAYSYILATTIVKLPKKKWIFPIILFGTGALGLLATGSRTDAISPIITLILYIIMLNESQNNNLSLLSINIKYYFYIILSIISIIFVFQFSTIIIGRQVDQTPIDYISTYLAAPLQNLDFAQPRNSANPSYFGLNTFKPLYDSLEQAGLVPTGTSRGRFAFISRDGYFTGNVYTTFYSLLLDFGTIGTLAAISFMSIVMQTIYELSLKRLTTFFIPLLPIIYGYLNYNMTMSFFASSFYHNLFSTSFLKAIVGMSFVVIYQHVCNKYVLVPSSIRDPDTRLIYR